MATVNDILKIAKAEIGVKESPANSNNVKYNTWYYGKTVQGSAYPWCAVFVSWLFSQVDSSLIKKSASCMDIGNWFKQNGRFKTSNPQVGDIVFFKYNTNSRWTNHIGIVESINKDGSIVTIEGNTSTTSNDNGGSVMRRNRKSNIVGYGIPKYSASTNITSTTVKGIDVSSYQGNINWEKVKSDGIKFAILRSTLKNGKTDTRFEEYYKGCKDNNIDISVYKYSYALTEQQSIAEANTVLSLLNGRKCKIWLDLEDKSQIPLGKIGIAKIAKSFIKTCEDKGYSVGVYCNLDWIKNHIDDSLKKYDLWIARYGKNNGQLDEKYKPNVNEKIWQYTSSGQVSGIQGNVDLSVIYGDINSYSSNIPSSNINTIVETSIEMMGKINTQSSNLNIRQEPNSYSSKLGAYKKGTTVQLISKTSNGWYRTNDGYISSDYVVNAIGKVFNCVLLNLRKTPVVENDNKIKTLPVNTELYLLKEVDGWYKVKTKDNVVGYVSKKYIQIL